MAARLLIALASALALVGGGYWWGHTATDNAWQAQHANALEAEREETAKETARADQAAANYLTEHLDQEDRYSVRAAMALGDDNFASLSKKLLEDYLVQHQATMDLLREAKDMGPMQRAETLASMSDSFNKTMASFKRLSPELNKQAIQLDVLQRLVSFAQARFPQHLTAMVELLEPFGEELAKVK